MKTRQKMRTLPWLLGIMLFLFIFPGVLNAAEWAPYTYYTTGTVVTYLGTSYTCRQSHNSLPGWEPPNVLSLWLPGGTVSTSTPANTIAATNTPTWTPIVSTSTPSPTRSPIGGTGVTTVTPTVTQTVTPTIAQTATPTVTPTVPPAGKAVPGQIEAEAYDAMAGVQTEATTDTGGGTNVGWIDATDWMDYNVAVASTGNYTVEYRVAAMSAAGALDFRFDGVSKVTTTIPVTGGWQTWTTVSSTVSLTSGSHVIRLSVTTGGFNLNWLRLSTGGTTGTPTPSPTRTPTGVATATATPTLPPTTLFARSC